MLEDASVEPPKVNTSVDVLYVKLESSTINPAVDTKGTRPEVKVDTVIPFAVVMVFAKIAPVPPVKEFTRLAVSLNVVLNSLNVFEVDTVVIVIGIYFIFVICKRSFLISFISFFNANISSATRCASATPLFILMFFCRFILYLKSPTESVFKIAFECKSLSVNPEIFSSSSIRFFISFGYLCEG